MVTKVMLLAKAVTHVYKSACKAAFIIVRFWPNLSAFAVRVWTWRQLRPCVQGGISWSNRHATRKCGGPPCWMTSTYRTHSSKHFTYGRTYVILIHNIHAWATHSLHSKYFQKNPTNSLVEMLTRRQTDRQTWCLHEAFFLLLRKIRIPMSHKLRMAACISVCLVTECYCATSPCPWSLRHSTFQCLLLQNATVWPVRVPDPLDTAHFNVSCYRMLLCDQPVSLIPYTQHISVSLVTECYCATSPCPWSLRHSTFQCLLLQNATVCPVRVPDPLHTAHSLTTREHSAIAVSAIFITEHTASPGTQHFAIDTALHYVARQRRDD